MYKLFYYPRNASWAPHMVLEEIRASYELILVDRKTEAQKSREYLKLNPTGRIPTLADGDLVIFESAAICLHLCDQNPQSNLVPEVGNPLRALCLQWLFYLNTTVQPELMVYFYPSKHTLATEGTESIVEAQEARIIEMFALLNKELKGKDFLVGNQLTICDFFLFMLSHWARGLKHSPLSFDNLGQYLRTLAQRPSIQHVCRIEGTDLQEYQNSKLTREKD